MPSGEARMGFIPLIRIDTVDSPAYLFFPTSLITPKYDTTSSIEYLLWRLCQGPALSLHIPEVDHRGTFFKGVIGHSGAFLNCSFLLKMDVLGVLIPQGR